MEMITEHTYRSRMDEAVMPFLEKCRNSGFFKPDGTGNIYFESYSAAQANAVVVLVHGFSESAEKYVEMIYYFLQAGYRVYIPELRGHGRSVRATEDLSMVHIRRYEQYLEDLLYFTENIIKKENPGMPYYLYAHSMGGGVGAAFLEKNPDVFQKAVLSSPMIRPLTGQVPFGAAYAIARLMAGVGKGMRYAAGQHAFRGDETFEGSAAVSRIRYEYYREKRIKEKLFQTSGASYTWLREAARMSADVLKKKNCRKIRAKVLVFRALQDDLVSGAAQEKFVRQVSGARLISVAETKHEIYMATDKVLQAYVSQILDFLQQP